MVDKDKKEKAGVGKRAKTLSPEGIASRERDLARKIRETKGGKI